MFEHHWALSIINWSICAIAISHLSGKAKKKYIYKPVVEGLEIVLAGFFFGTSDFFSTFIFAAENLVHKSVRLIFSSDDPEDTLDITEPWLSLIFTELFALLFFSSAIFAFCNIFSQSFFFSFTALLWNLPAELVFAGALNLLWIDFFVGDSCI